MKRGYNVFIGFKRINTGIEMKQTLSTIEELAEELEQRYKQKWTRDWKKIKRMRKQFWDED